MLAAREFYRHRQIGWGMYVGALVAMVLALVLATVLPSPAHSIGANLLPTWLRPNLLGATFIVATGALMVVLVGSLEIAVDAREIQWRFGIGLIRKRVDLSEIDRVEVMRTSLRHGWGIHLSRQGTVYNVSGFDALAFRLRSGKRFILGTDEPRRLKAALERAMPRLNA